MHVLAMITGKNVRFLKEPATINNTASTANTKLKYVNTLLCIISCTDFDGGSTGSFVQLFYHLDQISLMYKF